MTEFIACQTLTVSKKENCSMWLAVQERFPMSFSLHTLWLRALQRGLVWLDQGGSLSTLVEVDHNAHLLPCGTPGVSKGRLRYNRAFNYMPNLKLASTHHLNAPTSYVKAGLILKEPTEFWTSGCVP